MRIAIMQPYFLPYLGYFQLISAVDEFVVADDFNYIKSHWVNRNRFIIGRKVSTLTLSLSKASSSKTFNGTQILSEAHNKRHFFREIMFAYNRAPEARTVMPLLEEIVMNKENVLSSYIEFSIKKICSFVGIETKISRTSEIKIPPGLKGVARVYAIIRELGADHYINSIGGEPLYDKKSFADNGIKLNFLKTQREEYEQFGGEFIPDLSIVDVLMFNPKKKVREMLGKYELN